MYRSGTDSIEEIHDESRSLWSFHCFLSLRLKTHLLIRQTSFKIHNKLIYESIYVSLNNYGAGLRGDVKSRSENINRSPNENEVLYESARLTWFILVTFPAEWICFMTILYYDRPVEIHWYACVCLCLNF